MAGRLRIIVHWIQNMVSMILISVEEKLKGLGAKKRYHKFYSLIYLATEQWNWLNYGLVNLVAYQHKFMTKY